uniref:Uncharacterized protein n=1 Tax=Panagrolaimus davidi TaxID=227884 RepID=A0A914PZI9_9BILA
MKLDVNRKLLAHSDRVKSIDIHPTETWMLASLYNVLRVAKFFPRKNSIITGSYDMHIRVFSYTTLE